MAHGKAHAATPRSQFGGRLTRSTTSTATGLRWAVSLMPNYCSSTAVSKDGRVSVSFVSWTPGQLDIKRRRQSRFVSDRSARLAASTSAAAPKQSRRSCPRCRRFPQRSSEADRSFAPQCFGRQRVRTPETRKPTSQTRVSTPAFLLAKRFDLERYAICH